MTNAKKTLVIASVIAALGAGGMGATTVLAAQHGFGHQGAMSGLVNAIAQKFHVAPSDVQAVIDEQHQQMADQMKKRFEERFATSLAQAVKDGKLTQAQADAITAKQAEIKIFKDSLQGKSPADRQSAMKTEMESLKQWAKDNNIPERYIMLGFDGMGPGMGMPGMKGGDPKAMLDQAVKNGKITQAQEDQIMAKQAEVKAFMEGLKDKSAADRQSAVKTEMDALKQWAKDNGIPEQYVMGFGSRGMQKGGFLGKGIHAK